MSSAFIVSIHHLKRTWKAEPVQLKLIQLLCHTRGSAEGALLFFSVHCWVSLDTQCVCEGTHSLLKTPNSRDCERKKEGMMQTHWRAKCCVRLQKHSWSLTNSIASENTRYKHTRAATITERWNISVLQLQICPWVISAPLTSPTNSLTYMHPNTHAPFPQSEEEPQDLSLTWGVRKHKVRG